MAEAEAFDVGAPKPLPIQALDHGTGYLIAFAAMSALARRAKEGGSWHVRASLAQTGYWIRKLGRIHCTACSDPDFDDVRGGAAGVVSAQLAAALPAHSKALQQSGPFSHGATTRLMRARAGIGGHPRAIRFIGIPINIAFMAVRNKHGPL